MPRKNDERRTTGHESRNASGSGSLREERFAGDHGNVGSSGGGGEGVSGRSEGKIRAKRWCFTINFGRESGQGNGEALEWAGKMEPIEEPVRYRIYQIEAGNSGTVHYQGYLECSSSRSLRQLKRLPGYHRAHFEVARGTREENIKYCSKEESRIEGPFVEGKPGGKQGKRSDLDRLKDVLLRGGDDRDCIEVSFGSFVRYHRGLDRVRNCIRGKRSAKPTVLVFFGPSGSNKTRRAHEAGQGKVYWKDNSKWWDGYQGEETVIWDDFDGDSFPFRDLLRVTDRYPVRGQVKGSYAELTFSAIIFTADRHPRYWYDIGEMEYRQLERRINYVVEFKMEDAKLPAQPIVVPAENFAVSLASSDSVATVVDTPPTVPLTDSDPEETTSKLLKHLKDRKRRLEEMKRRIKEKKRTKLMMMSSESVSSAEDPDLEASGSVGSASSLDEMQSGPSKKGKSELIMISSDEEDVSEEDDGLCDSENEL